jgi:hypothetical protein
VEFFVPGFDLFAPSRVFFLAAASALASPGLALAQGAVTGVMPDGPGKDETVAVCGPCHGPAITTRLSDTAWSRTWSMMTGHGMVPPSPEMKQIIMTYLRTYLSSEREPPATPAAAGTP